MPMLTGAPFTPSHETARHRPGYIERQISQRSCTGWFRQLQHLYPRTGRALQKWPHWRRTTIQSSFGIMIHPPSTCTVTIRIPPIGRAGPSALFESSLCWRLDPFSGLLRRCRRMCLRPRLDALAADSSQPLKKERLLTAHDPAELPTPFPAPRFPTPVVRSDALLECGRKSGSGCCRLGSLCSFRSSEQGTVRGLWPHWLAIPGRGPNEQAPWISRVYLPPTRFCMRLPELSSVCPPDQKNSTANRGCKGAAARQAEETLEGGQSPPASCT